MQLAFLGGATTVTGSQFLLTADRARVLVEPELLAWIGAFANGKRAGDAGFPRTVFITHGDPPAETALEPKVRALGFATHVAQWRETVTLD